MLCRRFGFTDPFLIQFPKMEIKKGSVRDADVKMHMKGRIGLLEEEIKEEKPAPVQLRVDLDEAEELIVKTLANGEGAFTSQIYQAAKMSGSTFKKKVAELLDKGVLGVRKAKRGKNRLYCYFITPEAKDLAEKYGPKSSDKGVQEVINMLNEHGWVHQSEGNKIIFEDEGNRCEIMVVAGPDRRGLEAAETNYFVCGSERLKNLVIQYFAQRIWKTGMIADLFVATAKDFAEKGKFERIEFLN
jgi:hypothetical protein